VRDPGHGVDQAGAQGCSRARAWVPPVRALAARVRLWAIAARTSRAAFASARGQVRELAVLQFAMTCSMMAWSRWVASASIGSEHGVVACSARRRPVNAVRKP